MRFFRLQSVAKAPRFFELFIALALLSCFATHYRVVVRVLHMFFYWLTPLVIFVIGNVIVILLLCNYRKNYAGWNSATNDLQCEYFQITEVSGSLEIGDETKNTVGDIGVSVSTQDQYRLESIDKTGEIDVNAESNKQVVSITESTVNQVQCDLITTDSVKVHQLQRTKSELLNSQIYRPRRANSESLTNKGQARTRARARARAQGKPRRSESEISSRTVSSFETVDKLSSEEFKDMIEAFIAKHKGL